MKSLIIVALLLTSCSGKKTYLDPRPVGSCAMIQGISAKFYKIAGLDSRGYALRELVVAGNRTVEVVEYSYLVFSPAPLEFVMPCKEAEQYVMDIWGGIE